MSQNQEKISTRSFIDRIQAPAYCVECSGLSGSERAYLVAKIYMEREEPVIVIANSAKEAEKFADNLRFFAGIDESAINIFLPYNILPFKFLSYHNETAAKRIRTLYQMATANKPFITITSVDALIQRVVPKEEICGFAELLMVDEDIEREQLVEKLIAGGYTRSIIVEEPGDFSVRGGIIDVFSPLYEDPLRIEFFGNTIESLRFFSAVSQRKTDSVFEAVILPAREAIFKKEDIAQIVSNVRKQASEIGLGRTKTREIVDHIQHEGVFPGGESLISLIYGTLDTFFDYLPVNTHFVQIEPSELAESANSSLEQASINFSEALEQGHLCVEPQSMYLKWDDADKMMTKRKTLSLKTLMVSKEKKDRKHAPVQFSMSVEDNSEIRMELKKNQGTENLLLPLSEWLSDKMQLGYTTVLVCNSKLQAKRIDSLFRSYGVRLNFIKCFSDAKPSKDFINIALGRISSGFVWHAELLAIITEDEIFGTRHVRLKTAKPTVKTKLLEFADLKKKDLVVHVDHGIGQYQGLVKLKVNGATNDFLQIMYKDNDKLYLPVDRMGLVQKYMGVDGITPVLDKMGSKSWERVKDRVKKSAEKIAGELLKLYAARKIKEGFSFKEIDNVFEDFEVGFSYEETQDQLKAIEDTLNDMQDPAPMDRLICGDVGYGKTEVALRASFLAVNNSKQVAVLVPTTVLAQQHFETFSSRFDRYPVQVQCLNRFRSASEQRKIVEGLKDGTVDIVIGTHRILQKDIAFKDLGLLVLDEEQRFGVKHKEKLKKMKSSVDVLALTATPIPRTLHMSMMGIRDISIISTPPEHRRSIMTYISEYDDTIASEAIRKELKRGGQIFFVHNKIYNIESVAKKLKILVPEVKLAVAHGRMNEDELEQVIVMFMNREIDMLVCTTIIESGLDIPSANTILVNRADKFGLAQIYQLRGRVGRAEEQAYAYLFIPQESHITKEAQKRLKVLMEHSDLGSGFQIAMSDLRLRGGGTILGASQSGHIAAVGYEMFLQLMETSISELKGDPVIEALDPEINISISSYIPENFISDIDQRLSAYRRLAKIRDLKEIADFKNEMEDRFGPIPTEMSNLLLKIMLKVLSVQAGVKRLDLNENALLLYFSNDHLKNPAGIIDMIVSDVQQFTLSPDHVLKAVLKTNSEKQMLSQTKNILKEIAQRVNC